MEKGPIQIVLNSNDFIGDRETNPGGSHKDFYAGHDREFKEHKKKISSQLDTIKKAISGNEFSEVSYAKVILKQSALAKSHRPTGALFKPSIAPVVGAGDLGELIVEVMPSNLDKIKSKISSTEEETRYKRDKTTDKEVPNPSEARSELGAIEEIQPYNKSDKRNFSVSDGLKWLSNTQTGGAYLIELFEFPPPPQDWDNLSPEKYRLFKSFFDAFEDWNGVRAFVLENDNAIQLLGVRIELDETSNKIQFRPMQSAAKRNDDINQINKDIKKHNEVISFLDRHPLVKKILLPPIISKSHPIASTIIGNKYRIPAIANNKSFPQVAIVDGGVSDVLKDWIEGRWGLLSKNDRDEEHGTFIAGITVIGNSLNGLEVCSEQDGCKIIDLDLLPPENAFANYYTEPLQFFTELEAAVKLWKARTGVRIFNFSLNIEEHVSSSGYSIAAKKLDKIALENDVIFIISAGNTRPNDRRKEWPADPSAALSILASSRNDIIKTPAESSRNISVSALNPPNMNGVVPFALSNYSCRGPGTRVGLKPDFGHIGGAGLKVGTAGYGLLSIDSKGNIVDGCGTSYAAPNVSKTVASLDHSIEGNVSRETLTALTVHSAFLPDSLKDPNFKEIVKHLVGFGVPKSSSEILDGSEHSITLVFANRIKNGKKMSFNFSWPSSLVKNNKCFGYAKLTLVSTPPFDHRYGAEFVRVNIEAHLRQEQKDGRYLGKLKPVYLPPSPENNLYEKNQISHSFKWSPVKVYESKFRGVGPSTNWKLEVEYLTRDGETMPSAGVPFTAILTISDPDGEKLVFNEMRQYLKTLGVQIIDIKTAARVTARV
jgi:hypothetical protein